MLKLQISSKTLNSKTVQVNVIVTSDDISEEPITASGTITLSMPIAKDVFTPDGFIGLDLNSI